MFPLDEKSYRNKNSVGSWGEKKTIEELSRMLKSRNKTKNDLNWNKELREDLQFICFFKKKFYCSHYCEVKVHQKKILCEFARKDSKDF
jgi:hypothetical protein